MAEQLRERDPAEALALAREAIKLAPDLTPASVLAGSLLAQKGDLRRAGRILETAWKRSPHPDLARAYVDLRHGDAAGDRLSRAKALGRLAPGDAEGQLIIARSALEARQLDLARRTMADLLDNGRRPTVRMCLMMADIEETEHGPTGRMREWLARAARAPRDPSWLADGVVSDRWLPASPITGQLDAFRWETPVERLGGVIDEASLPIWPDPDTQQDAQKTAPEIIVEKHALPASAAAAAAGGAAALVVTHTDSHGPATTAHAEQGLTDGTEPKPSTASPTSPVIIEAPQTASAAATHSVSGNGRDAATPSAAPADPKEASPETGPQTRQSAALEISREVQNEERQEALQGAQGVKQDLRHDQDLRLDHQPDLQPASPAEPNGKTPSLVSEAGSSAKAALPEHFLTAPDDPGPDTTSAPPPAPARKRGLFG